MKPEYRNARYIGNDDRVDCEIKHPEYGWIPYTLDPQDADMTIDNNELLLEMSKRKDVAPYVAPTQEEIVGEAARNARYKRDIILGSEVDPIVTNPLRWADMKPEKQQEWADYRLALLAVPEQSGFPLDINWPTKPE